MCCFFCYGYFVHHYITSSFHFYEVCYFLRVRMMWHEWLTLCMYLKPQRRNCHKEFISLACLCFLIDSVSNVSGQWCLVLHLPVRHWRYWLASLVTSIVIELVILQTLGRLLSLVIRLSSDFTGRYLPINGVFISDSEFYREVLDVMFFSPWPWFCWYIENLTLHPTKMLFQKQFFFLIRIPFLLLC